MTRRSKHGLEPYTYESLSCRRGLRLALVTKKIRTVKPLAVVVNDALDLTLALELANGNASEGAVDLQAVNDHRRSDHLEARNLLHDTLVKHLVKVHGVLGLKRLVKERMFLHTLSLTRPFDHFFFFPVFEAAAAIALFLGGICGVLGPAIHFWSTYLVRRDKDSLNSGHALWDARGRT